MGETRVQIRLYKIKDEIPFRTGYLLDGSQLLISRYGSEALAIHFSKEGELLGCDSYSIGPNLEIPDEQVDAIFEQLGITPGTICVRKFVLPEYEIEIRNIPDYLQDYIDDPSLFDEEDAPHLEESIANWNQRGSFVIIWGNDYYMDSEGGIEST